MVCGWQSVIVTWYVGDSQWQWHDTWVTVSDSDMIRGWQSVAEQCRKCILRAYSHQRQAFLSDAEILLRIYQNPIHLNGARWHVGGRRFSVGELHTTSKTSSANGSHLNVWDFDISAAEFPQQKKRASLADIAEKYVSNLPKPATSTSNDICNITKAHNWIWWAPQLCPKMSTVQIMGRRTYREVARICEVSDT